MQAQPPLATGILLAVLGCGGRPATSPAAVSAVPDGTALRPTTLTYQGQHHGDHPSWSYRAVITIAAAERDGRPIWRRTSTFGDAPPIASTFELDRQTLAPIHSELRWRDTTMRLDFSPGRTTGVVEVGGTRRELAHEHREPVVLVDALDLYVAALPLGPGFQTRIAVLDFWLLDEPSRYTTRDFTIRVTGEEVVTVPAGAIPVFVVALDPTDGNPRLRSIYHVVKTRPHYQARAEYVVNPETVGAVKRSTGVDQLVSRTDAP